MLGATTTRRVFGEWMELPPGMEGQVTSRDPPPGSCV